MNEERLCPYGYKLSLPEGTMIKEFSASPRPSNNKAKASAYILFASAIIIFFVSMKIPHYRGVVSLFATVLLIAGILIYTRYISPLYYYDIMMDSEGTPLFVVRALNGKRETTLCRIALYEIMKVEREDRAARRAHKTPKTHMKYVYVPTLDPDVTCRLTTASRYERSEIIIEASEEFATLLRNYSIEAREMAQSIEDDY